MKAAEVTLIRWALWATKRDAFGTAASVVQRPSNRATKAAYTDGARRVTDIIRQASRAGLATLRTRLEILLSGAVSLCQPPNFAIFLVRAAPTPLRYINIENKTGKFGRIMKDVCAGRLSFSVILFFFWRRITPHDILLSTSLVKSYAGHVHLPNFYFWPGQSSALW